MEQLKLSGKPYKSYSLTPKELDIMRLSERRDIICSELKHLKI